MASLINKYFHQSKTAEQNIINGFVKESIQILGSTYYYLPREVQVEDLIFGEDILSKFSLAIPIEMYLADFMGFQGDREMFSKFGLEIRNTYKLVVSQDRWVEEVKSQFDDLAENGEAAFDKTNYLRPHEGDLIYDPITKFLFEIKFVDHDVEFFALGRNYKYYLSCESFKYQNEIIDTGDMDIDLFARNSTDKLLNQILLENGNGVMFDQGGLLLTEEGKQTTSDFEYLLEDGNIVGFENGDSGVLETAVEESIIREYGDTYVAESTAIKLTVTNPFG